MEVPMPVQPTATSPHQMATELSDIRREIARLQRREAALVAGADPGLGPRPGWPMQRLPHAMGDRISTSSPARIA